jgi:Lon protease-like protein
MTTTSANAMVARATVSRPTPGARRLHFGTSRRCVPSAAAFIGKVGVASSGRLGRGDFGQYRRDARGALLAGSAASDDIEPPARDYKGELRMPSEIVERPVILPAMLFPLEEVLLPGSTQVLHLYEARFLALLDEATNTTGGLFAHLTFHPPSPNEEGLRINQVASLVRVEEVIREDVGAKVVIVGESRVHLQNVIESDPYVRASFTAIPTMGAAGTLAYTPSDDEMAEVEALTEFIDSAVNDIVMLADRLMSDATPSVGVEETDGDSDSEQRKAIAPGDLWDISDATTEVAWGHAEVGNLRRAMAWVDGPNITLDDLIAKNTSESSSLKVGMDEADWLRPLLDETVHHSDLQLAERLSFACLQVAPTSTEGDLRKLVSCRNVALSTAHGLMDRLKLGQIVLDEQRQALRAKVALKSAFSLGDDVGTEDMDGGVGDGR